LIDPRRHQDRCGFFQNREWKRFLLSVQIKSFLFQNKWNRGEKLAGLTIKDIAKICNVSISTVSRAINNDHGINPQTRERVLQVVKQFGYVPNNSARNLKMAESNTIALMIKGLNNPFFQGMFPYFQQELEKYHYEFLLHSVSEDVDEGYEAEEIAKEKRLKGIIFLGGRLDYPEAVLGNIQIPFVLCSVASAVSANMHNMNVSSVSIDDEKEAYKVVQYLISKGHRDIAMIAGKKHDHAVAYLRVAGYRRAMQDYGLDPDLVCYQDDSIPEYTEANGYVTMKRLLESGRKCTAVFVIADRMATGAYKAIYDSGKRIPEDISVVGFDGIELGRYLYPSLTTMVQPVEQMVESSVKLLQAQIMGDDTKKHLIYDARLLEADSVLDLRTSAADVTDGYMEHESHPA